MLFWFIFLGMWFFQPQFPETVYWIIGSATYMWTCLMILCFLYFYVAYFLKEDKPADEHDRYGVSKCSLFFLFGILAGWTIENTALGMIAFIVMLLIYMKYRSKRIPVWMYWGLAGAVIGTVVLITAPGNFIRLSSIEEQSGMIENLKNIFYDILLWCEMLIPIYLGLLILTRVLGLWDKKTLPLSLMFFLASIVSILAMAPSPNFPSRAWFGVIAYMLIACGLLFAKLNLKSLLPLRIIFIVICIAASAWFVREYVRKIPTMQGLHLFWEERDDFVQQKVKAGVHEITFDTTFDLSYGQYGISDIAEDATYWMNGVYSRYYGLDSVRLAKDAQVLDLKKYYRERRNKR